MTVTNIFMTFAVGLCLLSFCRQSLRGKDLHGLTGSIQVFSGEFRIYFCYYININKMISGLCVMIAIFCHMLGWGVDRVHRLCGPDSAPFYAGECYVGMYYKQIMLINRQ